MKINAVELEKVIIEIEDELNSYNDNNEKIIHEHNTIFHYWVNNVSDQLKAATETNDNNTKKVLINTKAFISCLEKQISKYMDIGEKIECNEIKKEGLIDKIDNIIDVEESIVLSYNYIGNIDFYPYKYSIFNQQNRIKKNVENLKMKKKVILGLFDDILKIELSLKQEINDFPFFRIDNEKKISSKPLSSRDWAEFKLEEVELSYEKLRVLTIEQLKNIEKIQKKIILISDYYDSNNNKKINEIITEIVSSMKNANNNNIYYNDIIKYNCNLFRTIKHKNMKNLEDINYE